MSKEAKKSSNTDATIKVIFVFLFCILSFAIGTFVGKKFSDNQHRLSALEPDEVTPSRSTASIPPDVSEVKPTNALSDEEIAKLADEFANEDSESSAQARAEEIIDQQASREVSTVAQQVAKSEIPDMTVEKTQNKAKERTPSSLPALAAQSALGKYTVQVASYSDEDEAKNFAQGLKEKGYSAFYIPAEVRGQKWFRVSVGVFTSQDEAKTYREKLLQQANLSSAIIQKIVK